MVFRGLNEGSRGLPDLLQTQIKTCKMTVFLVK